MTAAEKIKAEEQKYDIYLEQRCRCWTCGTRISYRIAEAAHVVPKSKRNLKKYGPDRIHHRMNIRITCPGKCNDAVIMDPATHPIETAELMSAIDREIGETNGTNNR